MLRRAAGRLMLVSFVRWLRFGLLAAAALTLAYVVGSRLLGLLPGRYFHLALGSLGGVALVAALLLIRRPAPQRVARLVDARAGTKELFLSAVLEGDGAGAFLPVVQHAAEERAPGIDVTKVVPFRWLSGTVQLLVAALLVAGVWRYAPQLDPFKKAEQRQKTTEQQRKLEESHKLTTLRAETLETESHQQAAQIQQALARLDKTFKEARPPQKDATLKQLAEEQRELGELWRKVNNDQLKEALDKSTQSFGQMDAKLRNELREQLQKGDLSGIKREMDDLQKQLSEIAALSDSAEKRAKQEQLMQKLSQFAQSMKDLLHSPQVDDALNRAMAQLDSAKLNDLSQEATKDAMESLKLSQKELAQLAQSMKDGKTLEEALKNLQMAKKLAGAGKLNGADAKDAQSQEDYEALFQQKMAQIAEQMGQDGQGAPGMGPGIGNGAKRPEDDSTKTSFKSEKSTSALGDGKMLLQWKTNEVGESGNRAEQFRDAVRGVQQGVSEALQAEQVPPGYHEAIKKYFDTLPATK